jgi:prophage regulatory protein
MTRNRRKDLTIEEARALADKWHAMGESYQEAQQLASRFADAGPHRVIEMWETGRVIDDPRLPRSRHGQPLSKFEVQALVERWAELFGCLPPRTGSGTPSAEPAPTAPPPKDDTMLRMGEVIRITGLGKSTIKRHVAEKKFPEPTRISVRRIGWQAGKVRAWLAEREGGSDQMPTRPNRHHRGRLN